MKFMRTKEETLKELAKQGYKELYVVDLYIENAIAGTNQWFVYPTKDEAKKFIKLCEQYYCAAQQYKKIKNGFSYVDTNGTTITQRFKITVYKRAA